ncbi:hypothetical protein [Streptomyces sp. NPDC047009]|uniref:hypothetical protein n=1 Tax=Streptomyces sp. NPDC047009 TaxID=3154496 RepID=UPI003407D27E
MASKECVICDEPIATPSELDDGICADCDGAAVAETEDELRSAGIDPDDEPVVIAAEVMRRINLPS